MILKYTPFGSKDDGKKQISINLAETSIDYFKNQSKETGIPYQVLIDMYLADCVKQNKKLEVAWK